MHPRRSTLGIYESFDISEGDIELVKIALSLERLYGQIVLTEFRGTFFAGFFPGLFFLGQGESTPKKDLEETQSM